MYCKNCGSQMIEGAKFCRECGKTVVEDAYPLPTQHVEATQPALVNPQIMDVAESHPLPTQYAETVVENVYPPPAQYAETAQPAHVNQQFTDVAVNYPPPQMQNLNDDSKDAEIIKNQAVKLSRARGAIISVFAFTAINLILSALDAGFYFVYSAFVPIIAYFYLEFDYGIALGLFMALAIAAVYLVSWALSKRWHAFILVALILFALDALIRILFGVVFFINGDGDIWHLVETGISAWIIIQLARGVAAWSKLKRFSSEQIKAVQSEIAETESAEELRTAMSDIAPTQPAQENNPYQNNPPQQSNTLYDASNPYQTIQPQSGEMPQATATGQHYDLGNHIDDTFKTQVVNIFKWSGKIDNVYLFEDIPPGKLQNAIAGFAPTMSDDEIPIILYDDTVSNNSKKGVLLTTKKLYCKEGVAPIASIEKITRPKGVFAPALNIEMAMRSDIGMHLAILKKPANSLFELLSQTVALLKERQA